MENLIGAKDKLGKIELALQSELLLKLSSKSEEYCPSQMVRAAVKLVCNSEKLEEEVRAGYLDYKNNTG